MQEPDPSTNWLTMVLAIAGILMSLLVLQQLGFIYIDLLNYIGL